MEFLHSCVTWEAFETPKLEVLLGANLLCAKKNSKLLVGGVVPGKTIVCELGCNTMNLKLHLVNGGLKIGLMVGDDVVSMWDVTCVLEDVLVKKVLAFGGPANVLLRSISMAEFQRWLGLVFVHVC